MITQIQEIYRSTANIHQ